MAIPRKGSRIVTVHGLQYRWRIRHKPTYCEGAFASHFSVAVERVDETSRCVLLLKTQVPRPDNWLGQASVSVKPNMIAESIKGALAHGWQPENCGAAFEYPLATKES
jgi:hypothetical protein